MSETPARYIAGTPNNNIRSTLASHGLEILKRCVLDVLYEARNEDPISQDTIRKQLSIPKQLYDKNRLVAGILDLLKKDEYVRDFVGGYWQIKEEGINIIES